jgi:uncharacterized membrane protein YgdD (TMEM256/DUF423 family)
MHRKMYRIAALLSMFAVALGAFGAHALKEILTADSLVSYQTATTYLTIHALALFIVGNLYRHYKEKKMIWASYLMIVGIVLFSGSIYFRVLAKAASIGGFDAVVWITPVGGVSFMLGWLMLFISIPKSDSRSSSKENSESA